MKQKYFFERVDNIVKHLAKLIKRNRKSISKIEYDENRGRLKQTPVKTRGSL